MNNGPGSLNRIFRLVWNDHTCSYVPACESARGRGKRSATVRAVTLASLLATGAASALAGDAASAALPQGGRLVQGQAQWQAKGAQLQISQDTARAAIHWQQFDIGSAAKVQIVQPDAASVLLNRVVGADASRIHGQLQANGQVLLVNPNGIVFGRNSRVDVGGIVASTLQISDADFAAGRHAFRLDGKAGAVHNQGEIRAARGGYAALLAPEVVNEGVVSAQLGSVALAAGQAVTLRLDAGSLLEVKVDPGTVSAMVANRELVQAEGGRVVLSAGAAQRLRSQGVAGDNGADALVADGGRMRLVSTSGRVQASGGTVQVSGATVDLDGQVQGARIAVQADHVNQNGHLDASASGRGGQIRIDAGTVVQTASARLRADGDAAGGSIRVDAGSNFHGSGTLSARSAGGQGGEIALTGDRVRLLAASLDASGASGGGRVRVGGGLHGADADLPNAQDVGINGATVLRADALQQGAGGQVVVWSDGSTAYGGQLSARGAGGGHGGAAEVSGKSQLRYAGTADLSAPGGKAGRLLLDPRNIIVDKGDGSLATLDLADPTPGDGSDNWFGAVTQVLSNGNVVISAPKSDTGGVLDTGAVYLFDSRNGALLANLRGAQAGDQIGMGANGQDGVQVLANGNYLVRSPSAGTVSGVNVFNAGRAIVENSTASAGAVTWQSATGGGSSTVSSSNSLVGSTANTDTVIRYSYTGSETVNNLGAITITANDALGGTGTQLVELANGNVVVANSNWYNGRGAVAWIDGSTGRLANAAAGGVLSDSTALVGATPVRSIAPVVAAASDATKKVYVTGPSSQPFRQTVNNLSTRTAPPGAAGDSVGESVTALPGGGYVVSSPLWSDASTVYNGAVTTSGAQGLVGTVSAANSLSGGNSYDYVGSGGVQLVGDGNFLVNSPYWSSASNPARGRFLENNPNGAVTWVAGATGLIFGGSAAAQPSSSNSLVGIDGQGLGAFYGAGASNYLAQTNYNTSSRATTTTYTMRRVANADHGNALTRLDNGNYLVASTSWNSSRGSVSFGQGNTGAAGVVSAANSLVGATVGDSSDMSVALLANNNFAWVTPYADVGATDGGAVTWGSGAGGTTGTLSAATSLYGSNHSDRVGLGGVFGVGAADGVGRRADYIVLSPHWGNRNGPVSTSAFGAVTWVDGDNGRAFGAGGRGVAVAASNSLVGSNSGDYVGSNHISDSRQTSGYNSSGFWTPVTDWDADLQSTVDLLDNGNYVVRSPSWNGGRGAATWGPGGTGVAGTVSAANSLVGSTPDVVVTTSRTEVRDGKAVTDTVYELRTTGDHVGLLGHAPSGGSGFMVVSPFWWNGKGAVTRLDASRTGAVGTGNSVTGSREDSFTDASHTQLAAPGDRLGTAPNDSWTTPVVSSWNGQTTTRTLPRGPYNAVFQIQQGTFYSGGTPNVMVGYDQMVGGQPQPMVRELSDGNLLLASPGWSNGGLHAAGAVTWLNGSTGAFHGGGLGAVSASNSLVGDVPDERIGEQLMGGGATVLANGAYVLTNPQWHEGRGAISWGKTGAPAVGAVSNANSLVGTTSNDRVGDGGVTLLSDGNVAIASPQWAGDPQSFGLGAVTWLNAGDGRTSAGASLGEISASNSLVGGTPGDYVGISGVLALANGAYAVASPNWHNSTAHGPLPAAGAVTFGAPGGMVGTVSAANSLVGRSAFDNVGSGGLQRLDTAGGASNYLVLSPDWTDVYDRGTGGAAVAAGAVTWVNGSNGHVYDTAGPAATVSATNSLVGDRSGRWLGRETQVLASGDAVVTVRSGYTPDSFSSVSLVPAATGLAGPISWRNSVFGIAASGMYGEMRYDLLPATVSAAETVASRLLVSSGLSYMNNYGARAVAMTIVGDDGNQARGADAINALAEHGRWTGSYFVTDAARYASIGGANGHLGFSTLAGDDVVITPAALTGMLASGTHVTLQASNDITVVRDLLVQASGQGGNLTLEAGRSVHLRGNITTDNGHVTVLANQSLAAGVTDVGVDPSCDSCVAFIGQAPGTRIDAGTGEITLRLLGSTDKAVNTAGNILLASLDASRITVSNAGLDANGRGMGVRFHEGAVIGNDTTQSLTLQFGGHTDLGGGLLLAPDTALRGSGTLSVAAADPAVSMRIGDGTPGSATLTNDNLSAVLAAGSGYGHVVVGRGDQTGTTAVGALTLASPPLASDLVLRGGSGGLELDDRVQVTVPPRGMLNLEAEGGNLVLGAGASLTADGGTLVLRTTGGGNVTQLAGAALQAAQLRLAVSGALDLREGTNTVDSLGGSVGSGDIRTSGALTVDAGGLTAAQNLRLEASGTTSDLTLDGVVSSTGGDLALAAGRNFVNNTPLNTGLVAGQGRYLVYSGHPDSTTEGMAGYNKHYAQAFDASSTPAYAANGSWFLYRVAPTLNVAMAPAGGEVTYGSASYEAGLVFGGMIDGDSPDTALRGALDLRTSSFTPSGAGHAPVGNLAVSLDGAGTATSPLGYALQVQPGTATYRIVPKALDLAGLQALNKVYDGTEVATLQGQATLQNGGSRSSDGRLLTGDVVAVAGTASGQFANRHVGQSKDVTVGGLTLSGADAGNYRINPVVVQAGISPKTLRLQELFAADSKVYDGTTDAEVTRPGRFLGDLGGSPNASDGRPIPGDDLDLAGTPVAHYNAATVAEARLVTFSGLRLAGADAGNYTLATATQAATITPRPLGLAGVGAASKIYDGSLQAALTGQPRLTGVVGNDAVTLDGQLNGSFADAQIGQRKPVDVSGGTLAGAAAGNYRLDLPRLAADIEARALVVAATNQRMVYGDADPALGFSIGGEGLAPTDSAGQVLAGSLATATGAAATAGSHAIAQGSLALVNGNYTLRFVPGTLEVDRAALTVRADDQKKKSGEADPALTWSVDPAQLRHGDTPAVVSGVLLATANGRGLPPGTYAITAEGGEAQNYVLTLRQGVYTVEPSPALNAEILTTQVSPTVPPNVPPVQPPASFGAPAALPAVPSGQPLTALPAGSVFTVQGGLLGSPAGVGAAPVRLSAVMPVSQLSPSADGSLRFDAAASFSSEGGTGLRFEARLADGRPLPPWLRLDPVTGQLTGSAPQGAGDALKVQITARDATGESASTLVELRLR